MINLDEIGYGNGLIYVGIPRERMYMTQFVDNRDTLLTRLAESGRGCGYWQAEGHRVDRNRDMIVQAFLNHPKEPEWLLMLDSDMEHPVEAPERLVAWKRPIVGALYFHRGQSHDPFVFTYSGLHKDRYGRDTPHWSPMKDLVYKFLEDQSTPMRDGAFVIDQPSRNPLIECDAIGTGCMMVHRSVFETMPAPWFEYRQGGNSEDLVFCKEAKELYGIPVHCDISTVCGHYHWVAMGQAQFRMQYINRGINLTTYTKGIAARWWSKIFDTTIEEALQAITDGSPAMVGDIWKKKFGKKTPSDEEVYAFYNDPEVGKSYAMELLHWNFLQTFNAMRKTLTPLHNVDVLEIGSGIGTVALQLWVQDCRVLAAEVNKTLRDFIDLRYQEMVDELVTLETGELSIVDDTWITKTPDETLDYVVSFETFEHMPWTELEDTIKAAYTKLKPGGSLIYTANFGQQDLYPMHYDYSSRFEELLIDKIGFERISSMELRKPRIKMA